MGNQAECCTQILSTDADHDSDGESIHLMHDSSTDSDSQTHSARTSHAKKQRKRNSNATKPVHKLPRRSSSSHSRSRYTPVDEANYSAIPDSDDDQDEHPVEPLQRKNTDQIEGIDIHQTPIAHSDDDVDIDAKMQSMLDSIEQNKCKPVEQGNEKKAAKKVTRKRSRSNSKSRNKYRRSSTASNCNKPTVDELQEELNEIEIKLQEQLHQTAVLKQENQALRQENMVLKTSMVTGIGGNMKNTKAIKAAHQIPPTPPYRMRSLASLKSRSYSNSPEMRPVSPITVNITTTNVRFQGFSNMNSSMAALRTLSPMVDPLPPSSYDDAYGNIVYIDEENHAQSTAKPPDLETADANTGTFRTPSTDSETVTSAKLLIPSPMDKEDEGDDEDEVLLLFGMGAYNGKCTGIHDCVSCKRIIKALEWYFECQHNVDLLVARMSKYRYGMYVASDYQHILSCHLRMKQTATNADEVEAQYDKLTKMIKYECNVNECHGYQRYQGKRAHSAVQNQVVSMMDAIHCYFLHLDCCQT
mmetsp:Transcript_35375/g.56728  ORF Transcript_35375/g.56728 Transcript_35375/m.56728 type:complete len:528 (-) Transcript_35375:205-1788(-)